MADAINFEMKDETAQPSALLQLPGIFSTQLQDDSYVCAHA